LVELAAEISEKVVQLNSLKGDVVIKKRRLVQRENTNDEN
jgi:hypothetical protein